MVFCVWCVVYGVCVCGDLVWCFSLVFKYGGCFSLVSSMVTSCGILLLWFSMVFNMVFSMVV